MDLQALRDDLSQLLGVEVSGLSRHAASAQPHLTPATYPIWAGLRDLSHSSQHNTQLLTDLFSELRISPRPVTFKSDVARFHFVDLPVLLPLMVQETEQKIVLCERALTHTASHPQAQRVLAGLLEAYRQQLEQLQQAVAQLKPATPNASGD